MPKEDRSDWVAVEPEFAQSANEIRRAASAYQWFQKEVSPTIREEYGKVDIAEYGRIVKEKWNRLSEQEKEHYAALHRDDVARYNQESHAADVAALQRKEKLRQERNELVIDESGKRLTRGRLHKKQKKEKKRSKQKSDDDDYQNGSDGSHSEGSWDSDEDGSEDDSDEDGEKRKTKSKKQVTTAQRQATQKQLEYRAKIKQEKEEKESYISSRQDDLRKERSSQAKKRLDYLLRQGGNIFAHFGRIKEDTAKYGVKKTSRKEGEVATRRDAADDDDEHPESLEEADEHEATRLTSQPSTLGFGTMRPYQLEGLNWMIRLQENGVNGILADEMGLGKTLQSISILVYMLEHQLVSGPHLIVVPKSTLSNWMNELNRWAPTLTAVRFHGDKATREEIVKNQMEPAQRDENREWNVCVTTYEVCNIEKSTLGKFAWCYLIIDEAHRLKNEASAFSKTVRMFETRHRILLSGTPLQNSLHELWALLNFLVPDVFESAEQFDEWFNLDIDDNDEKNKLISQLHKILRPFMLRRLKADVEKSLPPKHETILFTGMSSMQKKLYRDILIRDIEAIHGTSGSRSAILNIVMQLRKCAGHPYLFPGVEDRTLPPLGEHLVENCGKMVLLDKLLTKMKELGHRVLLFTQMTKVLDIMEDYMVMRRFQYCRIDGNTSHELREEYIDSYNAPDSEKFIFLLSTRAGGLGINLQTADVVILYDSDWNPQADLQAQDRAHRIGQKKPVQVFRLVTEHTIEEKIVERAQQKLKLDAMVVQQGRLKDKDKLSRDELLVAVRFGADKIFKSKDSSITDDDIDLILQAGKRKTEEMNEKLKTADKGDLLDFKLDGSSVQTFEGVDYSLAHAKSEMVGIFDIGKRERKEANYNENSLYQRQVAALQGANKKPKKKKQAKLPKHLRLPRMEEWHMYDRQTLTKIQEEEEIAFRELPEEQQKAALNEHKRQDQTAAPDEGNVAEVSVPLDLPPLLPPDRQVEKEALLSEGFSRWSRHDFSVFVKLSAKFGRDNALSKIALELAKPDGDVKSFMDAFWGDTGKTRISEHEHDRVVKLVERGEKKIQEIRALERGSRTLVSLFDNPWKELVFTHVNCKDKMFTVDEDRHLLCWAQKYGYGQWHAVRLAIRRNPRFRFDYFLRSLPVDQIGRRCEQLMRAAEKEVEQLEKKYREDIGVATKHDQSGELSAVKLPKYKVMLRLKKERESKEAQKHKQGLEDKVNNLQVQIQELQSRLKRLNEGSAGRNHLTSSSQEKPLDPTTGSRSNTDLVETNGADENAESKRGAIGPGEEFVTFPEYDGSEPPLDWKKPFTHFCIKNRKELKLSLPESQRKDKKIINSTLKDRWSTLTETEKSVYRDWTEWDKKRFARDEQIFNQRRNGDDMKILHVPKKRKISSELSDNSTPKRKKR